MGKLPRMVADAQVSPVGTRAADAARARARRSQDYRDARDEYAAVRELREKNWIAAHIRERRYELDLTQKQVSALWLVSDNPGISQIDLGGRLRMDRATTMTIVNRLQARAYLRRERSASDGRKQALYLTEAGAAALAEAKRCIGEHEAWLKSRFTAEEIEKLVEMLARIHE